MQVAVREKAEVTPCGASAILDDWDVPAERIGRTVYEGYCLQVEAVHVAYQQKAFTFGHIAGVVGVIYRGYGGVGGGGGSIDTRHESVVTAVVRTAPGQTVTIEVPSGVAVVEGSRLRLDYLNGHLIGVTNISGKGRVMILKGARDFIAWDGSTRADVVLAIISVICLYNAVALAKPELALAAAVAAIRPVVTFVRIRDGKRRLAALTGYMVRVLSSTPAGG